MTLQDTLRTFAEERPDILALYLFGSRAGGKPHLHSDIDVAVLLPYSMDKGERFRRRLTLIGELEPRLGAPLDLLVLNDTPSYLAFRVFRDGVLLFERDHGARIDFQVRTMSLYYDEKYYRDYHLRRFIERVKEQGFGYRRPADQDALEKVKRLSERYK
ncbi:MAG: nucleotidyltransferase domain-containing protein [Anaerolineae bacterium]|nr:nucleotidyltransferase domain-containing protein [Anaerolineae bacterium]